ncbi:MAG: thermonuclease family protein [Alphaproteobacteria bacterium]|nr:thermonuclease family protein [Alphaproteobacteria bacterium]
MKPILAFFVIWSSIFILPAAAQEQMPHGDFSSLTAGETLTVERVIDPLTIQMRSGQTVFLTGLHYPDFDRGEPGEFAVLATGILRDMLEGQEVVLYRTKKKDTGRTNRFGHEIAHMERAKDKAWVQGMILTLGLAQVETTRSNPEMDTQMLALEQAARAEKTGLWETDAYKILTPDDADLYMDSFRIVEGRVQSAALNKNRLYLNFGPDWKTDFTLSIAPSDRRLFSKQGLDPMAWNGLTLRARGWLRSYNGPYMEVDHPQAVEVLAAESAE